jgi:hypothetical protein
MDDVDDGVVASRVPLQGSGLQVGADQRDSLGLKLLAL